MERRRSKPVSDLPETIHSLLGLKAQMTSAWAKSVCNIVKNVSSSSSDEMTSTSMEEDDSVFIQEQSIRDQLSKLTMQVNNENKRRRKILNEFLDLKGNIRVFCRVKPLDSKTLRAPVASDTRNVIVKLTETKRKTYSFDRVFQPNSSQDDVFLDIEPVIKSVIDGYNACIFAYGQTGTGKTFTMEGIPESPGLVPRAFKELFRQIEESNHMFVIKFSMLEIYMGNLRDLLVSQVIKPIHPVPPSLVIHTDVKGEIEIENLVTLKVKDFDEVFKLYKLGCRNRATAFTNSNSASSRSHCMIRVSITCLGAQERRRETNKIWLVDLGGSERVLKTRATGRRFDEGKAINLSLSALGDVINSLQHKNPHIPFRNSKLTQVLKDSLGQDSKTLMLVHISPKENDICETICSLNFATRAKNIHLGQEETREEQEKKEIVMMNLLKMMEKIEKEREAVLKEMRHLKAKLEKITGKPQHVMEEEDAVREEVQVTPKIPKKKSRRVSDVYIPSFMRPTASSRRRLSGTDSNVSGLMSGRNSMIPIRGESVRLPVKKNSFNSVLGSSDRSVSRSACVILDDASTAYSEDISECDIKLVVSEHKQTKKVTQMGSESAMKTRSKMGENVNQKVGKTGFSRVNSWLHSQSENTSYVIEKKCLLASAFPDKPRGLRRKVPLEKSSAKRSTSETMMLNDLFELQCLCSSETEDQILSKYSYPEDVDDESLYPLSSRYDCISQHVDNEWLGVNHSSHLLEQETDLKAFLPEMGLDQSLKLKSQRSLVFMEDVASSVLRPQEILGVREKAYTFMQKLVALGCIASMVWAMVMTSSRG